MAGRGSLRASDADRDAIVDRLRGAASEGRLAAHELEDRVGAALRACTYGELDATVADLPGQLAQRSRSRRAVATVRSHPALLVAAIPVVLVAVAIIAAVTLASLAIIAALFIIGRRRVVYHAHGAYVARRGGYGPRRRAGYWA